MPRPCTCERFVGPSKPWSRQDGNCIYCYQYHHNPAFRAWCDGLKTPVARPACSHLGEATGEMRDCPGCGQHEHTGQAKIKVKLLGCGVHKACTTDQAVAGVACCKGCPDYQSPPIPQPVVRNLAYHIAPASGNGVWQRNVEQLLRRMHLFNGRKIIAIVTGKAKRLDYKADFRLDSPEMVKRAFEGHGCEFITLPNDPALREVVTFLPLLNRLANADPRQITFYGHAKGVTRPINNDVTVHRWTEIMYETCLDHMPLVEAHLARYPITGSFKKLGLAFDGSRSSWHYSGTFYWLRHSAVFSRPKWREVDRRWWGNESWPGLHFSAADAGCLFHEGKMGVMDLFSMDYLKGAVEPEYAQWRAAHAV